MPIEHELDRERRIHRISVIGSITIAEFSAFMAQLTRSPDYEPDLDALWDLRQTDFEQIDAEFWQNIVRIRREHPERNRARLAHLVEGDFAYGMIRMYQILSELDGADLTQELGVFKDAAAAEAWLASSSRG